jgi:type IV pilus assembly protein PilA
MKMREQMRKAFTLVELMVVIMIVAILAAVLVPTIRGRVNRARWSEGMAGAGTIATALRAYCAEQGVNQTTASIPTLATIGLSAGDLQGKYFTNGSYAITALTYDATTGAFTYTITVTAPSGVQGGPVTLNEAGVWAGVP